MMFNENSDLKEIVLGCRVHDDEAFCELIRRYIPLIKKMISEFDSDYGKNELFSEACLALHRAALGFDFSQDEVTFGVYARTCIHHHFVDLKRCKKRIPMILDSDIENFESSEEFDLRLAERERLEAVIRYAKETLSDYEYAVLLYHMQGYKTSKIAEKLGRSAKSVDNAKARIFRRLRNGLEDIL